MDDCEKAVQECFPESTQPRSIVAFAKFRKDLVSYQLGHGSTKRMKIQGAAPPTSFASNRYSHHQHQSKKREVVRGTVDLLLPSLHHFQLHRLSPSLLLEPIHPESSVSDDAAVLLALLPSGIVASSP